MCISFTFIFPDCFLAFNSMDDVVGPSGTRKSTRKKTMTVAAATNSGTHEIKTTAKKKRRPPQTKYPSSDEKGCCSTANRDIEDFNFEKDDVFKIRASLLDWYDKNQRDLPWRRISSNMESADGDEEERDRKAYAVWVSEIMLQQTRVQTVIDYFNRWMHKWPTLYHLSQASLEEVNEIWAGLGYYRRARFLLEGAKMIVEGGGGFPRTLSALRKVRGIGDYTAGAIASIAFKEVVPVVDGNVIRVIARLKTISANPKDLATVKNIWKLAGQLVDPCRPGDFNQALMELGATICTPSNPSCSMCPISGQCHALSVSGHDRSVNVTDYPVKIVKVKQRHEFSAVGVVEIIDSEALADGPQSESSFLLVKRSDEGLLAGLWEFPSVLLTGEVDVIRRRDAIDHFLKSSFNLDTKSVSNDVLRYEVGEYVHIFSHIRLKMYVELLVLHIKGGKNLLHLHSKQDKNTKRWKYVNNKDITTMGLTSGVRKVYTMIEKFKESRFEGIPGKASKKSTAKGAKKLKRDAE